MAKKTKVLSVLSKVAFNLFAIVAGLGLLVYGITENSEIQSYVGQFLNDTGQINTYSSGEEAVRYKTWYSSVRDNFDGSGDVAKAIQSEGTVLLHNENNALPLNSATDKISFYGVTAYTPIYSLDGAGEIKINSSEQQFFTDEMRDLGFEINEELEEWYLSDEAYGYWRQDLTGIYNRDGTTGGNNTNVNINGANWGEVDTIAKTDSNYNTAIFVTGRITNEGVDVVPNINVPDSSSNSYGTRNNDYFNFTEKELDMLDNLSDLRQAGTIDKLIVMFNTASLYTEDIPRIIETYNIDAALWIGLPGSHGVEAVCDILAGKSSPSGGLSDHWYASGDANPSTNSFGANNNNVVIQEDIYLDYKYAETRYADYVLGSENAGTYNYDTQVSYPFGYGLSYSSFEYSNIQITQDEDPDKNYYERYSQDGDLTTKIKVERDDEDKRKDGDDLILSVDVENTGEVAAKEIVQVYLNKPYTDQNKTDGVQKSYVELVGFGKTSKLASGDKETVEIKIDANKYFASYNDTANNGEGAYEVDNGTYYLTVARNSHQATNNILLAQQADGSANVNTTLMDNEYGEGNASLVKTVDIDNTYTDSYVYWTKGGTTPKNIFEHANPNKASGESDYVTFMDRSDWESTYNVSYLTGVTDSAFLQGEMNLGSNVESQYFNSYSDATAREYYSEAIERLGEEEITLGPDRAEGETTEIQLYEMIGVEYDPNRGATEEEIQKWEDFMDQLTRDDIVQITGNGRRQTYVVAGIGKPQTNDVNASNGISWKYDMTLSDSSTAQGDVGFASRFATSEERDFYPAGYPCGGIVAATFNIDAAYALGQSIGEDALWSGASGLYGFGLGLHRSPYHGRTGEFYSGDSYLAGMIGGYASAGAQSKGLYVYNKHFVLNDQENGRSSYNTWLREQTFRETYIRPFEIAIEIGDAMNVMTAFNSIGSWWAGADYNLMTVCLRDELGMAGFAVTDWYRAAAMTMTYGMLAGQDLPDGYSNTSEQVIPMFEYTYYQQAARQAARRILYTVANSNAMNFYGEGTIIEVINPNWIQYREYLLYASYGFIAAAAAFLVTGIILGDVLPLIPSKKKE